MKKSLLAIALMTAMAAYATNKPTPTPSNPTTPVTVTAGAAANSASDSAAAADANNSLSNTFGRQNLYVFPAPVNAAPLPANLCPQGDSLSWSIGWNFFSYAKSSTRTEMDCLDKVLATIRATQVPVVQPTLAPMTQAEQKELACLEQPKKVVAKKKVVKNCS